MCADFTRLVEQIDMLERANVEYIHVDIMDGHFVPNFTLGPDFVRNLRGLTTIPMDIHLMVEEPGQFLDMFEIQPGDLISVHQEATVHLQRTLQQIRSLGGKPCVALNPATCINHVEDVLDDVEAILVMTVNPGFAGQKLVPSTLSKIQRLRAMLDNQGKTGVEVEVDGNVSLDHATQMYAAGANIFVGGTSAIFRQDVDEYTATTRLRDRIS